MQLTKEQLTDAYKRGLSISIKNGNIKIVAILGNVYGINHFNTKQVQWWLFEQFEEQEATIEQSKPKYNGRAVKCDTVEQMEWYCKHKNFEYTYSVLIMLVNDSKNIGIENNTVYTDDYAKELNFEIISFSQYCKENDIKEPKWIQGFEVKDGYNEIVSCSNDNVNFRIDILKTVYSDNCEFPFTCVNGSYRYVRYPRKGEINEIKFIN